MTPARPPVVSLPPRPPGARSTVPPPGLPWQSRGRYHGTASTDRGASAWGPAPAGRGPRLLPVNASGRNETARRFPRGGGHSPRGVRVKRDEEHVAFEEDPTMITE